MKKPLKNFKAEVDPSLENKYGADVKDALARPKGCSECSTGTSHVKDKLAQLAKKLDPGKAKYVDHKADELDDLMKTGSPDRVIEQPKLYSTPFTPEEGQDI